MKKPKIISRTLPLELQSLTKGIRTSAIIMVIISVISVYFIPWAIFYIILAAELKPEKLPNRKMIKLAAILTLPLCLGLIPIIIDAEFWKMNRRLKEYEEYGAKAFISNKEFLALEPTRRKNRVIAKALMILIVTILILFIVISVVSENSNKNLNNTSNSALNSKKSTPYTSTEHGFRVNFPGLPQSERKSLEQSGYTISYTIYSADTDNGNKAYLVGVYDFTGIEINETGALEGAVNGAVQNIDGAVLVSSKFSTFLGLKCIEAYYTAPLDGKIYDGYISSFIKNGKMYAIFTIGVDQKEFNEYVGTFAFTE